ncbi:Gfo/Idh/MocA family protein [Stakelama saccharophila]|uniref:Gfo/Idh/MocA family oxidoreductase n=1 Tax=Stakelama saccharophila TaxID=3075605 RepID=A0ABZ0BCU3_9SPHN|nr:Gfo/Idh/MocA family oxidoreductase [Stakelama sp. W311]WNO55168.1 Gfo/Idh/MocA family oxidoreductase [Stakelama sp. W311]
MAAICETGLAAQVLVADPDPACRDEALRLAPGARAVADLAAMLDEGVDGVAIATPSALHSEQAVRALQAGTAVFCQKPLGRTAGEAGAVVAAAHEAGRLLAVDFSYRRTRAVEAIVERIRRGDIGRVFAVDLTFHNAYGPDKAWFYDPAQSGGGCIMDLGVHLVDLLLWSLGFPEVHEVRTKRFAGGKRLTVAATPEDYALATLSLGDDVEARLACSWNLSAGQDAVIEARFHGTEGGLAMCNRAGSFYDFDAWHFRGTTAEQITSPPDAWGGRAASDWIRRLARDRGYDASAGEIVAVAQVLDRMYGERPGQNHGSSQARAHTGTEPHRKRFPDMAGIQEC